MLAPERFKTVEKECRALYVYRYEQWMLDKDRSITTVGIIADVFVLGNC
jgi:hypothetical protein